MPEADINEIAGDPVAANTEADALQYSIALTPEEYSELEMLTSALQARKTLSTMSIASYTVLSLAKA